MGEECKIVLDKDAYYPGQAVNGVVVCNFPTELKINGIRVRFQGKANTLWLDGRYGTYRAEEKYFDVKSKNLCEYNRGKTTSLRGEHKYPFLFHLPYLLPPSVSCEFGAVQYFVQAVIERSWTTDIKVVKLFIVHSHTDLNTMDEAKRSIAETKTKKPFSVSNETGLVTMNVQVPIAGCTPSQMVTFSASVKNDSNVNVHAVRFRLAQRFEFLCKLRTKRVDTLLGQKFAIIDSFIPPKRERAWSFLQLRVPDNVHVGDLSFCGIVKSYFELRGEVVFPIPYRKMELSVPLVLGNVALIE